MLNRSKRLRSRFLNGSRTSIPSLGNINYTINPPSSLLHGRQNRSATVSKSYLTTEPPAEVPNGVRDLSQNDGSRFLFSVLQALRVRSFTTLRMTGFKIWGFKKTLFATGG